VVGGVINANRHFWAMPDNGLTTTFQRVGFAPLDVKLDIGGCDALERLVQRDGLDFASSSRRDSRCHSFARRETKSLSSRRCSVRL